MDNPTTSSNSDHNTVDKLMDPLDDSILLAAAIDAERNSVEKALNEDLELFKDIDADIKVSTNSTTNKSPVSNTSSDTDSSFLVVDDSQNGMAAPCNLNTSELNYSTDSSSDELTVDQILESLDQST